MSRLTGSVLPGVACMCGLNTSVVCWRLWYTRKRPIRLRVVRANPVIRWWSWYDMALDLGGVGGWALAFRGYLPLCLLDLPDACGI